MGVKRRRTVEVPGDDEALAAALEQPPTPPLAAWIDLAQPAPRLTQVGTDPASASPIFAPLPPRAD